MLMMICDNDGDGDLWWPWWWWFVTMVVMIICDNDLWWLFVIILMTMICDDDENSWSTFQFICVFNTPHNYQTSNLKIGKIDYPQNWTLSTQSSVKSPKCDICSIYYYEKAELCSINNFEDIAHLIFHGGERKCQPEQELISCHLTAQ